MELACEIALNFHYLEPPPAQDVTHGKPEGTAAATPHSWCPGVSQRGDGPGVAGAGVLGLLLREKIAE